MQRSILLSRMMPAAHLAAGFLVWFGGIAVAAPADPTGTWLTEDGRGRIRVEHCGVKPEQVCGYVVWTKDATDDSGHPRKDESNKDPAKRSRPLLGHQLILGLKPNSSDRYEGQIYDADNGKKYDITLWREAHDELRVKGCMLSVLCGSQTWALVTDVAPGQMTAPTGSPNGPRPDAEWSPDKHPPAAAAKPAK